MVDKRVRHKCINPAGIPQWYNGKIISLQEATIDGDKTIFTIKYDEEALSSDEPITEEFPILKDLRKKDLIIVD